MDSPKLSSSNPDSAGYLRNIGNRIKSLRALRGMSRRLLAQRSGVSERYLAELENGNTWRPGGDSFMWPSSFMPTRVELLDGACLPRCEPDWCWMP